MQRLGVLVQIPAGLSNGNGQMIRASASADDPHTAALFAALHPAAATALGLHAAEHPASATALLGMPITPDLGGATSRVIATDKAYTYMAANAPAERQRAFFFGNRLFNTNWVEYPGLGQDPSTGSGRPSTAAPAPAATSATAAAARPRPPARRWSRC